MYEIDLERENEEHFYKTVIIVDILSDETRRNTLYKRVCKINYEIEKKGMKINEVRFVGRMNSRKAYKIKDKIRRRESGRII